MIDTGSTPWGSAFLAVALALALALFAYRVLKILRLVRAGQPEDRLDHFLPRLSYALLYVFGQTRVFRNRVTGAAHLAIFYGFIVIGIGTINMVWQGLLGNAFLPAITESNVFMWLVDILAGLVILAVLVSAIRRYVVHPPQVHNTAGAALVLSLIFLLMVTLLMAEASRRLLGSPASPTPAALLFAALSGLDRGQLTAIQSTAWWAHILLVAGFLAYIPYSKHMHLIVCPFNGFLRPLHPKGELSPADADSPAMLGAGQFDQLGWKQLLDLFACTECGRCQEFCPAHISGTPLNPRQLILDLKHGLLHRLHNDGSSDRRPAGGTAVPDAAGREAIWACTTCRACQEHCPVFIEHIDKIIEARRFLLEREGASPALTKALEGMALLGNPQMLPPSERTAVLNGFRVPVLGSGNGPELLLWLGCAGAYEPSAQDSTRALLKILKAAKVDFAVLGPTEKCCGDTARRTGEEGLFQDLARYNIENMQRLSVKKVLTSCPHCFNTFKNEYPRFGSTVQVVHHTVFITDLIRAKRLEISRPFDQALTYHDPCYLGRYNDVYESPREILRLAATGGIREMARARETSLCCGGGGGQMYLESAAGLRANRVRFAEVESLSVPLLVTACPSCKLMMDDAARYDTAGSKVRVKDIAEIVAETMVS